MWQLCEAILLVILNKNASENHHFSTHPDLQRQQRRLHQIRLQSHPRQKDEHFQHCFVFQDL